MSITVELVQTGPTTTEAHLRRHSVIIDRPTEKEGNDRGPMGGELLLAALGGCFASNLLAAVRARDAAVSDVRIVVEGELVKAPPRFESVTMTVRARCADGDLLAKLVAMSERACIVANTLREGAALRVRSEARPE